MFATRRVGDAFAIVDVGAPGVEVLHENRPVGRSGPFGKVVVSDVPSLQRSKIAIAPETLPGESHASITETEIMPSFRGSATVNIKTIAAKDTARVELRDAKGAHFTPGTRVIHEESGQPFTIGYGGLTFLPEIDDENTLHIQQDNKGCTVRFKRADRTGRQRFRGTVDMRLAIILPALGLLMLATLPARAPELHGDPRPPPSTSARWMCWPIRQWM